MGHAQQESAASCWSLVLKKERFFDFELGNVGFPEASSEKIVCLLVFSLGHCCPEEQPCPRSFQLSKTTMKC